VKVQVGAEGCEGWGGAVRGGGSGGWGVGLGWGGEGGGWGEGGGGGGVGWKGREGMRGDEEEGVKGNFAAMHILLTGCNCQATY